MSVFTDNELAYLASQRLGRLATVGADGTPHVVPVGFRVDPERDVVEIGGARLAGTKKFRDVRRHGRAAFVVDDLASTDPWRPRGVEIRGRAEAVEDPAVIRIVPERIRGWGLDGTAFGAANTRVVTPAPDGGPR